MKSSRLSALIVAASLTGSAIGGTYVAGCTPALQAVEVNIEAIVKADIIAGKSDLQIVADINQALMAAFGSISGFDVEGIILKALDYLIALGVIPKPNLAHAGEVRAAVSKTVSARSAAVGVTTVTVTKTDGGK